MNLKKPDFNFNKPDMSQVKVPKVVEDVYQDLRDRKLLPIVGLLVVAIIAVPILLSSSSSTPTVTEAPPAELVAAPEAQAAVLAEDPGLRNYQQRLDALKSKNPFDQQFQVTVPNVGGLEDTSSTGATDTASGSDLGGTSTSTSSPSSGGGGSTGTAADAVTDESTTVDIDETVNNPSEPQLYSFRVDVRYGPEGDVKEHENVKLLDLLEPVGAFMGGTESGKKAVFALSSDVAAATGQGECAPDPGNCEFLLLKEGQTAGLTYQPDDGGPAVVYKLGVDEIRLVKVKDPDLEGKLAE